MDISGNWKIRRNQFISLLNSWLNIQFIKECIDLTRTTYVKGKVLTTSGAWWWLCPALCQWFVTLFRSDFVIVDDSSDVLRWAVLIKVLYHDLGVMFIKCSQRRDDFLDIIRDRIGTRRIDPSKTVIPRLKVIPFVQWDRVLFGGVAPIEASAKSNKVMHHWSPRTYVAILSTSSTTWLVK